ncbi:MAG TPA: WD40 repeat domain-containing protein [Acidobacteriota bacterium]|nr:WD40 repeat domain-containing protein [Acidobacteriota bacterium]
MNRSPNSDRAAGAAPRAPTWKVSPAAGKYYINSVAVSADGARVLCGTFYHHYGQSEMRRAPGASPAPAAPAGTLASTTPSPEDGTFGVYCYNVLSQLAWKDEFAGWQGVYWVALSANGARAAAGGFISATAPQGFLRAYDATNGRSLLSRTTQQRVNQVAFSGDGTWLVSAAETLLLFRYDVTMGQYVQTDEFVPEGKDGVVSVAISADGMTVLYAGYSGHIGLFANDAGKLQLRARWKVPGGQTTDFCHMLELALDGKTFVAGGANGTFYYSDVASFIASGAPVWAASTNVRGAVYGVAIAEDGSLFAGVFNQGAAGDAWVNPRPGAGAGAARHFALEHNPNSAALNAAHRLFAVADGHPDGTPGCFYLFDTATGAARWQCPTGNMSWPIAIAANGSAVVGGSDDSFLYYFAL